MRKSKLHARVTEWIMGGFAAQVVNEMLVKHLIHADMSSTKFKFAFSAKWRTLAVNAFLALLEELPTLLEE